MSFLSALVAAIVLGVAIGLLICVLIGGIYVVFLFLRDLLRRKR